MIYNAYAEKADEKLDLQIVSCGHIFAKQGREIYRPDGRQDWLLFYIVNESETFFLDGTEVGHEGSFIIFAPNEKQHHVYLGSKTAEFYYVHFQCEGLPESVSLDTSVLYHTRFSRHVCDVFAELIDETFSKLPLYQALCSYKLLYILTLLKREVLQSTNPDRENYNRVAFVVQDMNKNYNKDCTLNDYAKMCNMSKFHFIRTFEKIVGCTPIDYRNNIRLQHAADLLSEEKLSVEEISRIVGFSSASYFSSAFKKEYGVSPKKFKKG